MLDETLEPSATVSLVGALAGHEHVTSFSTLAQTGTTHVQIGTLLDDRDVIPIQIGNSQRGIPVASQYRRVADRMATRHGLLASDVERALIRAQVASVVGVDAFVTQDRTLLDLAPEGLVQDANAMSPESAAAAVGLFLRSSGELIIPRVPGVTDRFSRSMYFWILARSLLGAA